jgi:hypothetical protein
MSNGLFMFARLICARAVFRGKIWSEPTPGQTSPACTAACSKGYYCPKGSTNSTSAACRKRCTSNGFEMAHAHMWARDPKHHTRVWSCSVAAVGRFNANVGGASPADCDSCPINSFPPAQNGSVCHQCPSGHHQPAPGSSTCLPCDAGMVFHESRGSCVVWPPYTSSVAGATSCNVCMADRYRRDAATVATTSNCVACPEGTRCGWNTTLATLNLTAGWWRVSGSSTELHRCDSWGHGKSSCAGGSWAGASGDDYCGEGFHGPLYATSFSIVAHSMLIPTTVHDAGARSVPTASTIRMLCATNVRRHPLGAGIDAGIIVEWAC